MYALLLFTLLIVCFFIIFWLIYSSPISTIFLQMTQCFSVSKLHTQTHTHITVEEHRLIKKNLYVGNRRHLFLCWTGWGVWRWHFTGHPNMNWMFSFITMKTFHTMTSCWCLKMHSTFPQSYDWSNKNGAIWIGEVFPSVWETESMLCTHKSFIFILSTKSNHIWNVLVNC